MGITGNDRAWKEELTAGEIFFCLFFGTLLFAKGVGLYDGQGIFRIFLLIASAFWGLKMLTTEWEIRELLTAVILLLFGWMAYRSSGEKAALVSMMVITGMKGVSVRKVFRTGLVIWTGCFVVTVLLALTGTIEPLMLVHNKAGLGYVIRNSLGYTHPNVLHISYVILLAFWFYTFQWTGKKLLKAVGIAFLGNLYIFAYSLSYTGFALTVFYLVLLVYISFRKKRTKAENVLLWCIFPVCALGSVIAPLVLTGKAFDIVNKLVNTRFYLSRHYLTKYPLTLFGGQVQGGNGWSVDCSYVYCLMYYGVVLAVLFFVAYAGCIADLIRRRQDDALAVVAGLLAAGFTEPFLFNFSFKNLTLLFLGAYFYSLFAKLQSKKIRRIGTFRLLCLKKDSFVICIPDWFEKVRGITTRRKKWITVSGMIAGIFLGGILGMELIHVPSYVIVNKSCSDRVGGREDYEIFGELPEEIRADSLQIACQGEDTKVYVFEGSTVTLEKYRRELSAALGGGALGGSIAFTAAIAVGSRKKKEDAEQ